MRLLIALIALLSGLSVPQAVAAVQSGRVDSSVVASTSLPAAEAQRSCVVRRALLHPRGVDPVARSFAEPVTSPAPLRPALHFGDCARE